MTEVPNQMTFEKGPLGALRTFLDADGDQSSVLKRVCQFDEPSFTIREKKSVERTSDEVSGPFRFTTL